MTVQPTGTLSARAVVERSIEAWNARDRAALTTAYGNDCEIVTPDNGAAPGHDAVGALYDETFALFPDNRTHTRTLASDGEVVTEESRLVGTNTGPVPLPDGTTHPATGAAVEVPYVAVHVVRDGLIVASRFYWDQMAFLGQLGLLPQD